MRTTLSILILLFGILHLPSCQKGEESRSIPIDKDELLTGFQTPPNPARPRVWWHWMNGNISQAGIREDLEWMDRTGIGGFQNFDANLFTPLVVEKKIEFMQEDWKEAFRFTTRLADSLGFEMAIAGSPGWSETGGPWVEPRDGMKKYVWTELQVDGGQTFTGILPEPSHATGSFQNVPPEEGGLSMNEEVPEIPEYYSDAAVIAFRMPAEEGSMLDLSPRVRSSGGNFSVETLTDGDLHTATMLPPRQAGDTVWIQYEFERPQSFKGYSAVAAHHSQLEVFRGSPNNRALFVSDDGERFRKLAEVPGSIVHQVTGTFPETTAKYWRLTFECLPADPGLGALFGGPQSTDPDPIPVAEFVLHQGDRIPMFEEKAGFAPWVERDIPAGTPGGEVIEPEGVVDLTGQMEEDGSLEWEVPEGNWKIIRLGYSLTGRENHPASPEATGLEVDKLDEDAVARYINTYLDMYADATGGMMGEEGLGFIILDSYEAGHLNWTHDMFEEFSARRGYDMKPWVPALAGYIVKSLADSEKFLWDFRKTIGEMIAENHYDAIGEELKKRGMGRYTESHENNRVYLADGMDVKRNAEVPMSAMWTPGGLDPGTEEATRSKADIRESASVANIYGQPYVAAESMTSIQQSFTWHPGKLKRTADMELASGLNRFVIHTSVHQPLDDRMPGFSLGPFGQYFTRQETWAEQARPWIDYLARSSFMLQQGRNVADVLYYYGENQNITNAFFNELPPVPAGYEYDFVNATALVEAIEMENGRLTARSGNTYRLLVLDETARMMTRPVLEKLASLLDNGAKVTGTLPEGSPSLADDPEAVQELIDAIGAHANFLRGNLESVLRDLGITPDVRIESEREILYRHRSGSDLDMYWLNNRSEASNPATISFRVSGKTPELWDPKTGEVSPLSYRIAEGRTSVNIEMEPWGTAFVVFADEAEQEALSLPDPETVEIATLRGPWTLNFEAGRGAPESMEMTELGSWSEQEEPGVKYFSGTATYATRFPAPEVEQGSRVLLDLGEVHNIAAVTLNGQDLGTVWKKPFEVEIGNALQPGENQLEIAVTNTWVNRLIGDAQPGVENKVTFTTMPFYQGGEELLPAGLLGEVRILAEISDLQQ